MRTEIDKMKFGSSPSNGLLKNGSMTGIRFNVDEKNEIRKMIMLKNHLKNRNFNLQERMMTVYTGNLKLQNKLDSIHIKPGEYDQFKTK